MVTELTSSWEGLLQQARAECANRNFAQAVKLLNDALEQAYHEGAPESASGEIFFNLGCCYHALGLFSDAQKRYKQALGTIERSDGPDSMSAATVLQHLGTMYCETGRQAEAEPLFSRACEIIKRTNGPDSDAARSAQQSMHGLLQEATQAAAAGTRPPMQPAAPDTRQPSQPSQPSAAAATRQSSPPPAAAAPNMMPRAAAEQAPRTQRKYADPAPPSASDGPTYDEIMAELKYPQPKRVPIDELVHPREKFYGIFSNIIGWFVYGMSCICLFGLVLGPIFLLGGFVSAGIHLGALRSSGVRVTEKQFPEVYRLLEQYCALLQMDIPEVLVVNEHGLLNAFAKRLHRKDMIVICSGVLEMAYDFGEKELAFVVCHELGHIKRGHVKWGWLHMPGSMVPFLGEAYSRGCEYTCDRIARHYVPDGALFGLVALATGTKLYKQINLKELYRQAEDDWGFWTWFHEIQSSHPNLVNRIRAIGIADEQASQILSQYPANRS